MKLQSFTILFLVTITSFGQRARLMSDNTIQIDSVTICQFQTDWLNFYVFNFSAEGAIIFNEKDARYKEVSRAVWRYFPDLKIKIVYKLEDLPLHIQQREFEFDSLLSGEVGKQENMKSIPRNEVVTTDASLQELKSRLKLSGGFFLIGESLPIIGEIIIGSNPTSSTIRTALLLSRVGQIFKLVGAGALILD